MKQTRTIRLPLVADPKDFLPAMEAYSKAFNLAPGQFPGRSKPTNSFVGS
jgi:hypothetical protein